MLFDGGLLCCGIAFVTKRTDIGSSAIARSAQPDKKMSRNSRTQFLDGSLSCDWCELIAQLRPAKKNEASWTGTDKNHGRAVFAVLCNSSIICTPKIVCNQHSINFAYVVCVLVNSTGFPIRAYTAPSTRVSDRAQVELCKCYFTPFTT